jgi:hypothetical protein
MKTTTPFHNRLTVVSSSTPALSTESLRYRSVFIMMLLAFSTQLMKAHDVKINTNMVIEADGTFSSTTVPPSGMT